MKEFQAALRLDLDAKRIRERLRDPRMIAQSDLRIAECRLGLARHKCREGLLEEAISLINESRSLAKNVHETYQRMSQESFRVGDVGGVFDEAERLTREYLI